MNSRLFISQPQKGNGNDHKIDARNSLGAKFSLLFQDRSNKYQEAQAG
jgi:hypothetical protein